MLEEQRLTYLSHLGIDNYMPRRVLPNAAASSLIPDEALTKPTIDVPVATEITRPMRQANAEVSAPTPALLTPASTPTEAIKSPESITVAKTPTVKTGTVKDSIRFTLVVWRIKPDILIIDSREPGAALPTDRLLQNILRYIGYPLAQLPTRELIRWPLFNEQKINEQDTEKQEARAMVQAYISAYCDKVAVKAILLMGKEAAQFALDSDEDIDTFYDKHCGQVLTPSPWKITIGVTPSLANMLHEPLQKRITWQALQTLFTVPS